MCHAINSNWHLTSTSHSVPCLFLLLWGSHCYLDPKKIFQSCNFIILRGVHKLSYDLGATSKLLTPKQWNATLFIPRPTHFRHHGTKFGLVGCPRARFCAPLHQVILTGQNCWGADTLRRTALTLPKKNLTICLKTPTCTSYTPPLPK
jgi:hypothetical protein